MSVLTVGFNVEQTRHQKNKRADSLTEQRRRHGGHEMRGPHFRVHQAPKRTGEVNYITPEMRKEITDLRQVKRYIAHLLPELPPESSAHRVISRFVKNKPIPVRTDFEMQAASDAFLRLLELHDPVSAVHSKRVMTMAHLIGVQMADQGKLSQKLLPVLRLGAVLHDVGKLGVRGSTLRKPGKPTDAEFADIKKHPRLGFDMLQLFEFSPKLRQNIPQMALYHHKVLKHGKDGRLGGYPVDVPTPDIPIMALIVAVADVLDARTSFRPYRNGAEQPGLHQVLSESFFSTKGREEFGLDAISALKKVPLYKFTVAMLNGRGLDTKQISPLLKKIDKTCTLWDYAHPGASENFRQSANAFDSIYRFTPTVVAKEVIAFLKSYQAHKILAV